MGGIPGATTDDSPGLAPRQASPTMRAQILALALPVLCQQMLVLTVNLSDRYLAGHIRESVALETSEQIAYQAAQTTAQYLAWFISSYIILVSVGSTALVARFTGAGDHELANRTTHQGLILAGLLGLGGSVLGLCFVRDIVALLDLEGEAALLAAGYLRPMFLLLMFQVIESAGIACLVGRGDTRTGLYVMAGVALVNLPLAWGLCLGLGPLPSLGFVGISLGTAISHALGGLAVVTVLARGRFGLLLALRWFRPNINLLGRLVRVSAPAGLDSMSVALCQLWFLSLVNRLGDVASGAHGIALNWEALAFLSGAAFGTAAMTMVGQSLGAARPERATRAGWTAYGLGAAIMTAMGTVFFSFAPQMFRLFCPQESQIPIVEAGIPVLRLVAFSMPALASSIVFTAALRGAGDTLVPVVFSWIGFLCVRIPLAHVLAFPAVDFGPLGILIGADLGLFGAWLAMVADIWVRGVFFLVRFAGGRWKTKRV